MDKGLGDFIENKITRPTGIKAAVNMLSLIHI